jgi:anti-sigma factor RsiW
MKTSEPHDHRACVDLFARMSEYLDGELDGDIRRKIEQHLTQCRSCRTCLTTLRRTVALCREMGSLPIPEDVSRRLKKYFSSLVGDKLQ